MSGIQTYDGAARRIDFGAMADRARAEFEASQRRAHTAALIAMALGEVIRMPARIIRAQILGNACPHVYTIADVLEAPSTRWEWDE